MRRVNADVAAKRQKIAHHQPAASESKSAQDAAVAPADDKEAQGKVANAEKMNAAKPGEFDKAAFIKAVNEAIAAQAPKNLDEADKFADSGKAEKVKGAVDGKVTDGRKASAKDIETTTKAAPDTSRAKEKQVVPLRPDQPPANPGAPSAADATPRQQPPEVTDFSQGPRKTDQQMADADVTEEQLARSNEPEFTAALGEKRKAEQHSATAPAQARTAEKQQLATAKSGAAASGAQAMSALTATRNAAGKQVDGGKGEAKSKDEQKREEVTARLQKVFDATQKDVEGILEGLDGKVDKQFAEGEKKARDAFNTDQKRRMKAYKDKRYGGFWGPAKWAKDKLMGMPEEANQLFQESRKLYVRMMQGIISSIADTIGTDLGKAKARIAKGRAELRAEVDRLPADLRQFGQEAAKDFAGKFDDLESEVNDKSKQLVQTLAQKYTQALNAVDEEIKKLQEANKGLVQKAVDAVAGVIKTINDLKNLLMGILAKAAAAITKIIKDPIGFLGNLVRAVGAGLQQFISNIGTHLQTGLVSWLLGTSAKAGIEIPSKFDLKGIIQLIASLLGLTWANIRARITRKGVPDQAVTAAEIRPRREGTGDGGSSGRRKGNHRRGRRLEVHHPRRTEVLPHPHGHHGGHHLDPVPTQPGVGVRPRGQGDHRHRHATSPSGARKPPRAGRCVIGWRGDTTATKRISWLTSPRPRRRRTPLSTTPPGVSASATPRSCTPPGPGGGIRIPPTRCWDSHRPMRTRSGSPWRCPSPKRLRPTRPGGQSWPPRV
ncbi:phage tail protein [Streptomyces canarius]